MEIITGGRATTVNVGAPLDQRQRGVVLGGLGLDLGFLGPLLRHLVIDFGELCRLLARFRLEPCAGSSQEIRWRRYPGAGQDRLPDGDSGGQPQRLGDFPRRGQPGCPLELGDKAARRAVRALGTVKTITASAVDVIGGAGNDTFISGGSGEKFTGNGGSDTFQGTSVNLNGDTITDLSSGDKILITDGNLAHFSFQQNGTTLTFDPDTSVSQTTRTITLSNAPTGRFIISADPVAGVDLTYYAPPPADFNGDGISDVLFQNSSGEPFIYEMNGTNVIGGGSLTNPGPSWHPKATGDFNGDGYADILWQNSDGTSADEADISVHDVFQYQGSPAATAG